MDLKLRLELIPACNWHQNLAQILPKAVWDKLRKEVYAYYNWTCCICEETGVEVHCHEVWYYDDNKKIQKLVGLQCLCKDCHNIKHWGRTVAEVHAGKLSQKYMEELTKHFCTVNNCSQEVFDRHKVEEGNRHHWRSSYKYKLDFGKMTPENILKVWEKLAAGKRGKR